MAGSDEQKLIDYAPKLYHAAKMAQMMAQKAEAKKHDAQWSQEEEDAYQAKLKMNSLKNTTNPMEIL